MDTNMEKEIAKGIISVELDRYSSEKPADYVNQMMGYYKHYRHEGFSLVESACLASAAFTVKRRGLSNGYSETDFVDEIHVQFLDRIHDRFASAYLTLEAAQREEIKLGREPKLPLEAIARLSPVYTNIVSSARVE